MGGIRISRLGRYGAVALGALVAGLAVAGTDWRGVLALALLFALSIIALLSDSGFMMVALVLKPAADIMWRFRIVAGDVSLNPASALAVIVSLAGLYWLVAGRARFPRGLGVWIGLFVAGNAVAAILSGSFLEGAEGFLRVVSGFAVLLVVSVAWEQRQRLPSILSALLVGVAIAEISVLLQPLGVLPYTSYDAGLARATGLFYHPWDVARYLIIAVPTALFIRDYAAQTRLARCTLNAFLVMSAVVAFFTYLKLAWFLVFAEWAVWSLWHRRKREVGWLAIGAAILLLSSPSDALRVTFEDVWALLVPSVRSQALSGRVWLWGEYARFLSGIGGWGLLLGQGFGANPDVAEGITTHNDLLRLLVTNGLAGTVAYAALVWATAKRLGARVRDRLQDATGSFDTGVARLALVVFVAYLMSGITTDASSYPSLTWYVWAFVGLALPSGAQKAAQVAQDEGGV